MPGDSGVPVVTTLVCLLPLHTRLRVHRHPAFPTPSIFQGERFKHNSGASRRGNAESHLKLFGCLKTESVAMNAKAPHPQSSSPGSTGRSSIPETSVMKSEKP